MIITALAALLATSGPVAARPQIDAPAPTNAEKPRSKATKYCVESGLTGTRIPLRECHTRAEWLDRGFDPLAK